MMEEEARQVVEDVKTPAASIEQSNLISTTTILIEIARQNTIPPVAVLTTSTSLATLISANFPAVDNRVIRMTKSIKKLKASSTYKYWSNFGRFRATIHCNDHPYSANVYVNQKGCLIHQQFLNKRKDKSVIMEGVKEVEILFTNKPTFSIVSLAATTPVISQFVDDLFNKPDTLDLIAG